MGAGMNVEQLRTVVASLQTAVDFSRALASAMPTLTQLLASSSLSDVQVREATGIYETVSCSRGWGLQASVRP